MAGFLSADQITKIRDLADTLHTTFARTITVYKNDDGSTSIGTMNAGLMGQLFGISEVMDEVYADQQEFIKFDASRPAPPLIRTRPGGGGGGGKDDAGC